jgi:hypothetical protein
MRLIGNSIAVGVACLGASAVTYADQTIRYSYDPLGRLTQTQITVGAGSGISQSYVYDPAGNRLSYQVSGSAGEAPVTLGMGGTVNVTSAGAPVTVSINDSSATGTVTFTENGVYLGSTWISNGSATVILEGFPNGLHTITASYSGDGTHQAQTTTFTVRVQNLLWLPAVLQLLLQD